MSEQPKPTPETQSAIGGVNSLGAVTERVFKRLYRGLNRRAGNNRPVQTAPVQTTAVAAPERPASVPESNARRDSERQTKLREALQRREQEIARLNGILSTLNDGIVMQDTDGRIVLINNAAQELLGSQKNFWQTELATLFESSRGLAKLDSELTPIGEPQRLQVNNRIIGAQLAAVADISGKQLGTMMVLRDVTQDAVLERLKDQFVTAISHELRTPMAVIKGVGEVIAAQGDNVPASNRKLLDTLSRNVDTLDRMVVELLDMSEMGAGSFTVRSDEVLLEPLVWSVVNGMATEIKRAKLDVTFMVRDETRLKIAGDEQRLRWAFGHVLQNALRYTEPNGHLEIRLSLQSRRANTIAIHFIDTGVGISTKDLPHVFERFYRGEPRTASGKLLDPRGLGQGLFIARTVAEAHGGMITVRSQPGKGSTFTMLLPALEPALETSEENS